MIQKKISELRKTMWWSFTSIIGITCITLSIYICVDKTYYWQISLVIHYTCALMLEVFVFESWDCFFTHLFFPYFIFQREITEALDTLLNVTTGLFHDIRDESQRLNVLNAPSYFFLSNSVANNFPELIESAIVKSYHSIYPGNYRSKWEHVVPSEHISYFNYFVAKFERGLSCCASIFFNSTSLGCRRLFIHLLLPFAIFILLLECKESFIETAVGSILGATIFFVIVLFFQGYSTRILKKIRRFMTISKAKVSPDIDHESESGNIAHKDLPHTKYNASDVDNYLKVNTDWQELCSDFEMTSPKSPNFLSQSSRAHGSVSPQKTSVSVNSKNLSVVAPYPEPSSTSYPSRASRNEVAFSTNYFNLSIDSRDVNVNVGLSGRVVPITRPGSVMELGSLNSPSMLEKDSLATWDDPEDSHYSVFMRSIKANPPKRHLLSAGGGRILHSAGDIRLNRSRGSSSRRGRREISPYSPNCK